MAAIADDCGAFLVADIAHVAGLVAGGAHPSPVPFAHVVTTTTHKTLRGPRGAMIMVTDKGLAKDPDLAKKIDQVVIPGMQGGPHNHTTAAIAVALLEASRPSFRNYAAQVVANAKALAEELRANGLRLVTGGTDTHLLLVDLTPLSEGFGLFARRSPRPSGHNRQQEHDPAGAVLGHQPERDPSRHADGDHPGNERAGDASCRPVHRTRGSRRSSATSCLPTVTNGRRF